MRDQPTAALNFIDNKILIHFIHRGLAYILFILIVLWTVKLFHTKGTPLFEKTKWLPLIIVIAQALLGIFTVLTSPGIIPGRWGTFEWMAQLHQLTGMLLLLATVWMLYIIRKIQR
jgi:cytochrome c oxidase assembly protein subunit 15